MPGIYGWRTSGRMNLDIRPYLVEASQTIYAGDLLVLVKEASNYNQPRVKKLTQTEITASYSETQIKGILGWATESIKTDSSGNVTQLTPSTVAGGASAVYALPGYSEGLSRLEGVSEGSEAEDKGNAVVMVALFDGSTEVLMQIAAASDAAITTDVTYLGTSAGIQITDTINFKLDTTTPTNQYDTNACFVITGVETTEPTYATSSKVTKVWARLKPGVRQIETGLTWSG